MSEEFEEEAIPEASGGAGERLRAAREEKGLSLEDVASETRIPQRHLAAIENDDFSELPGRTYALGFARSYAKLVELDSEEIVERVRGQLRVQSPDTRPRAANYQPGDPARAPSRGLAWFALAGIAVAVILVFVFMREIFTPAAELPSLVEEEPAMAEAAPADGGPAAGNETAAPGPAATAPPTGPVVFTALEEGIWVKFYDASGAQLMQKQMAQGESYTVPATAEGPQIWTGRPDALSITIGGRSVPKLAEEDMVMRDIPVTAEALLDRGLDRGREEGVASPT